MGRFFTKAPGRERGRVREEKQVQSEDSTTDAISVGEFRAIMQETRRALGKQLEILNTMRGRVGERPLVLIEKRAA